MSDDRKYCRHCLLGIPYNTVTYHGLCKACWDHHESGALLLDGCTGRTQHGAMHRPDAHDQAATAPQVAVQSPTWVSVVDFARRMEHKLSLHRDRGDRPGWLAETVEWLFARGVEEGRELAALMTHRPEDREANWAELVANECADQANLLMMLADKVLHDYPRDKGSR